VVVALLLVALLLMTLPLPAQVIGNDASCDISVAPAATLMLPYFQTDEGTTTIVTITNVSAAPQIAAVTLWSQEGAPVLRFDLQLTGYDVQSVDLRTVLTTGVTASPEARRGARSLQYNQNQLTNAAARCGGGILPPAIREAAVARLGGGVGWATIDVVAACRDTFATEAAYYDDLLYDNALIGDWQLVENNGETDVAGTSLVHIRAVPEGGPSGTFLPRPQTFYGRLTAAAGLPRGVDRRQPLPAVFAMNWRDAPSVGNLGRSSFLIWREPPLTVMDNNESFQFHRYQQAATFDDRENPFVACEVNCGGFQVPIVPPRIFSGERIRISDDRLAPVTSGSFEGWLYLDLNRLSEASQAWVVVLQQAGRRSVLFDAVSLGNGCSPLRDKSEPFGPL
jgi:hypothetical protein